MWPWIIVGLAFIFLILILALCIPLEVDITYDSTSKDKFRLRLAWAFRIIGFEVLPYPHRTRKKKRPRRFPVRKLLAVIRIKGLTRRVRSLLKDICSMVRIRELALKIRFSMGEPALAGIIYGLISGFRPLLRLPPRYRVDIEPSFTFQYSFEGNARCILSVQPIKIILPFCRFILSAPGRRAARMMLSRR